MGSPRWRAFSPPRIFWREDLGSTGRVCLGSARRVCPGKMESMCPGSAGRVCPGSRRSCVKGKRMGKGNEGAFEWCV